MEIILALFEVITGLFFPGPLILIPFIIIIGGPLLMILCKRRKMSGRWGWRLFLGSLALTSLAGYIYLDIRYPTYSWRQKLTIEVETPKGIVTGSSVVAVKWETVRPMPLVTSPRARFQLQGEATIVELPDGRYLFALLDKAEVLALRAFAANHFKPDSMLSRLFSAAEVVKHREETRVLQRASYPMLVTFTDIHDPASVKEIDPSNLAEWFGSGVSLKAITLTITSEPRTVQVEKTLPWLKEIGRKRATLIPKELRNDRQSSTLRRLSPTDFASELYR